MYLERPMNKVHSSISIYHSPHHQKIVPPPVLYYHHFGQREIQFVITSSKEVISFKHLYHRKCFHKISSSNYNHTILYPLTDPVYYVNTQNFALEKLSFLPRLCSRKWFFSKQWRFIVHRSSHTKNPKYNLLNCFCLAFNAQWQYFKVTLFIAPYKYRCQHITVLQNLKILFHSTNKVEILMLR